MLVVAKSKSNFVVDDVQNQDCHIKPISLCKRVNRRKK